MRIRSYGAPLCAARQCELGVSRGWLVLGQGFPSFCCMVLDLCGIRPSTIPIHTGSAGLCGGHPHVSMEDGVLAPLEVVSLPR
jgi:hypothetical protein